MKINTIYSVEEIKTMLANKEISQTDSMVLEFKRKEYESDLAAINKGKKPAKLYGKKMHPIHIDKIVEATIRNNGRLSESSAGEISSRYNINQASIVHISCVVAKECYPDRYEGKPLRSDRDLRWDSVYIFEAITKYKQLVA